MDSAFVVSWVVPVVGREKAALDYANEVNEHWGALAAQGKCSQPELFFFSDGHGQWMVKGEASTLQELFWTEESQRLIAKGQLLLSGFSYDLAATGTTANEYLLRYAALGQELGII